jgi:mono/diheme cytochrome c family protein
MFLVIAGFRSSFFILMVAMIFSAAAPARAGSTAADEQAGAVLFRDKGCTFCHGVGGVGTKKAPSLVDIRKNKLWPPEKMTAQILNGGKKMPPFEDSVTDQEVAQLVAYLRARHRPVPPPAAKPAESAPATEPAPPQ